jgi:hypothetical protein
MSTSSVHAPPEREAVLIVYGDPPAASLEDSTGRPIGKPLTISPRNQPSFENALRRAMAKYFGAHVRMANARLIRISSAADFVGAVKRGQFTHVVYYGHAVLGANALLPSLGKNISGWQLADALKHTAVKHFDMLGCETMSLGAELSTALPGVEIGFLRAWRQDNFEVDRNTLQIKNVQFDPVRLYHFGSNRQ